MIILIIISGVILIIMVFCIVIKIKSNLLRKEIEARYKRDKQSMYDEYSFYKNANTLDELILKHLKPPTLIEIRL